MQIVHKTLVRIQQKARHIFRFCRIGGYIFHMIIMPAYISVICQLVKSWDNAKSICKYIIGCQFSRCHVGNCCRDSHKGGTLPLGRLECLIRGVEGKSAGSEKVHISSGGQVSFEVVILLFAYQFKATNFISCFQGSGPEVEGTWFGTKIHRRFESCLPYTNWCTIALFILVKLMQFINKD